MLPGLALWAPVVHLEQYPNSGLLLASVVWVRALQRVQVMEAHRPNTLRRLDLGLWTMGHSSFGWWAMGQ